MKALWQYELGWIRLAYLINQHVCTEVLERQLELLQAVVDGDLDGDGSIRAGVIADVMAWSRHDGGCEVGGVMWCVVRLSEGTSYVTAGEPSLSYYPVGSGGAPFL